LGHLAEASESEDLPPVVEAIEKLSPGTLDSHSIDRLVQKLRTEQRADLLQRLAEHDPAIAAVARPHLAAAGDLTAQRHELDQLRRTLAAGESIDRDEAAWLSAVRDPSLFDDLVDAYRLAAARRRGDESPRDDPTGPLQTALEQADPHRAISLYESLSAQPPWPGAQFVVDRRDAVLQELVIPVGQQAAARIAASLGLPLAL
jgi:hypothetical protein